MTDTQLLQNQIELLRQEMGGDLPPWLDDDHFLHRWVLHKENVDISVIADHLMRHVLMRRMFGMEDPEFGNWDKDSEKGKIIDVMSKIGAFRFPDPKIHDRDGNLLVVYKFGQTEFSLINSHVKCSDIVWYAMAIAEMISNILKEQSNKLGKPVKVTIIQDLEGFQLIKFMSDGFIKPGGLKAGMDLFEWNYPEQNAKYIVINAPAAFDNFWFILSPLLTEVTRKKTIIVGKDYHSTLLQHFDPELLPMEFGGNLEVAYPVPLKEWSSSLDIYDGAEVTPKEVKTINIKADKQVQMLIRIPTSSPCLIRWWFRSNKEVKFYLEWDGGHEIVSPIPEHGDDELTPLRYPLSLSTTSLPEFGTFKTNAEGCYRMRFENTSAFLFGRKLEYEVVAFNLQDELQTYEVEVMQLL